MLVVLKEYRGNGIATKLVKMAIDAMIAKDANEVCVDCCLRAALANG